MSVLNYNIYSHEVKYDKLINPSAEGPEYKNVTTVIIGPKKCSFEDISILKFFRNNLASSPAPKFSLLNSFSVTNSMFFIVVWTMEALYIWQLGPSHSISVHENYFLTVL